MQRIEHNLARLMGGLVGELGLGKGDIILHPVGPEIGRLRMQVERFRRARLRLAARRPLAVDVLPAMLFDLHKLDRNRVHGPRVEVANVDLDNRKHATPTLGDNHFVGLRVERAPQFRILELGLDVIIVCREHVGRRGREVVCVCVSGSGSVSGCGRQNRGNRRRARGNAKLTARVAVIGIVGPMASLLKLALA